MDFFTYPTSGKSYVLFILLSIHCAWWCCGVGAIVRVDCVQAAFRHGICNGGGANARRSDPDGAATAGSSGGSRDEAR
jgi:hypothetical protein